MARILRPRHPIARLAVLAVVAAFLFTGCFPPASTPEQKTGMTELNADRTANGIAKVALNTMLQTKAQAWAEKLARDNALSHSDLRTGISGCWRSLGENVGFGPSIAAVEDAYMLSPAHRANILKTNWNYAGVGVAHNGSRVYTVQVFMDAC